MEHKIQYACPHCTKRFPLWVQRLVPGRRIVCRLCHNRIAIGYDSFDVLFDIIDRERGQRRGRSRHRCDVGGAGTAGDRERTE